ncbi:MAG: 50S ribosomal protein L21 [Xanthomonadales bacterium]|nr:50S ribosomal protein L21 [Xanthomonadales bacterium]
MYAVFSTGGKQYRASTGDIITVEKLEAEKGSTIALDKVLMVGEGADVQVGTPFLDGGKVTAKVVDHGRGDKIKIVKFKRRKGYMRTQGHRQYFTKLEITGIDGAKAAPAKKEAAKDSAEKPEAKKAPAKKAASKKAAAKKAPAKKAAAKKTASKKTAAKKTAAKAKAAEDKGGE